MNANRAVDQVNALVTTNNEFSITGVQLTATSSPLPFQHENYGTTLSKCQRYYYKSDGGYRQSGLSYGVNNSGDGMCVPYVWPVRMRVNPATSIVGGSDGGSNATIEIVNSSETDGMINLRSSSGDSAVYWSAGTIFADAEL